MSQGHWKRASPITILPITQSIQVSLRPNTTSLETKNMSTPNLPCLFRCHCQRLDRSRTSGAYLIFKYVQRMGETKFILRRSWLVTIFLLYYQARSNMKRLTCGHTAGICFMHEENGLLWWMRSIFFPLKNYPLPKLLRNYT